MSRIGNRGFTLIEVIVATAILATGIVFIYESFFISLDSFGYCSDYLNVVSWADEKVWEVQDDINRFGFLARIDKRGNFRKGNKNFYWELSCRLIGEAKEIDLYKVDLKLSWQMGRRKLGLVRSAYATYKYKESGDAKKKTI